MALQDIDIHLATIEYVRLNGGIPDEDSTWNRALLGKGNVNLDDYNFQSSVVTTPTEQNLIDTYNAYLSEQSQALSDLQTLKDNMKSLKDFSILAQQYSSEIKTLYLAVMQADFDRDDTATRFASFATIIDSYPSAFKNRFNDAFQAEYPSLTVVGVSLANLLLWTNSDKAVYIGFCRKFITVYGQLLGWSLNG